MCRSVGRIVEVRGIQVRAELYELMPPYLISHGDVMISPRINMYVKTKAGLDTIICQITGEYYDEIHKGQFTGYYLELTVRGYFKDGKFLQGLRLLPMVAADVEVLSKDDLYRINDCRSYNSFRLGKSLFDVGQAFYLNYNAIIPSHIGIFGNTGSGKSNTLSKILHEYAKVLKDYNNAKLLIFDLNNEYGGDAICFSNYKIIYSLSTRTGSGAKVPLNLEELSEDEWSVLLSATEATQRPVIKTAYRDSKSKSEYTKLICQMINAGQQALVRSIRFNMRDYISGLENLYWHSKQSCFYFIEGGRKIYPNDIDFLTCLKKIKVDIPTNPLDKFLFKLYFSAANHIGYGIQYDFISPLLRRAEKLIADFKKVFKNTEGDDFFGSKNIAVIQLGNVNQDMTEIIPSIITSHLFENQVESKADASVKEIVNIVIDEAHNLLYSNIDDVRHQRITLDVFEKAIKEGRKFGLYLWIASQRPSDISSTIISQMHNYFIHKLVNPNDISRIRKSVAFLDESSMDSLSVLGPGECIISGTAMNMPVFVHVDQLDSKYRPNSENVELFGDRGILEEKKHKRIPLVISKKKVK